MWWWRWRYVVLSEFSIRWRWWVQYRNPPGAVVFSLGRFLPTSPLSLFQAERHCLKSRSCFICEDQNTLTGLFASVPKNRVIIYYFAPGVGPFWFPICCFAHNFINFISHVMHKLVHKLHDLVVYEKRGVYVMDFLRAKLIEGPLWHAKMSLTINEQLPPSIHWKFTEHRSFMQNN